MRKKIYSLFAIAILATAVTMAPALAMTSGPVNVTVDVPFNFKVGKLDMPAGEYEINRSSDTGLFIIRNVKTQKARMFFARSAASWEKESRAHLVFRQYGDQYFLAEIVVTGNATAYQLAKSKAERRARKNIAGNFNEGELVKIYAD